MKKLHLLINFYKSFAFACFAITISCMYFPFNYGIGTFSALFWFKFATLGIIFYLNNSFKRNEFYYYRNLGVSKKLLWSTTLSFDMILYLTLFYLTLKYK